MIYTEKSIKELKNYLLVGSLKNPFPKPLDQYYDNVLVMVSKNLELLRSEIL